MTVMDRIREWSSAREWHGRGFSDAELDRIPAIFRRLRKRGAVGREAAIPVVGDVVVVDAQGNEREIRSSVPGKAWLARDGQRFHVTPEDGDLTWTVDEPCLLVRCEYRVDDLCGVGPWSNWFPFNETVWVRDGNEADIDLSTT